MKTYVLIIFGNFDDHEDILFFVNEIFVAIPTISSLRYILEDGKNLTLIFDSDSSDKEIISDIFKTMSIEQIRYYFLFEKEGLMTSRIPKNMSDHLFKPIEDKIKDEKKYDLDELLEKIQKSGVKSLTPDEKNFLENFEN